MVIRFSDISEQYRNIIDSKSELFWTSNQNEKRYEKALWRYFKDIKDDNEKLYNQLMGLVISDDYKMLYNNLVESCLLNDHMQILELYRTLEIEEIINYYENEEPELLVMAVGNLSEFNCNDYFGKREILIKCNQERKKLYELSPFCVLDYLYYCNIYDIETLKSIFLDLKDEGYSRKKSLESLADTVNQLFFCDTQNYLSLTSDMLYKYYILRKNNYFDSDKYNIMSYLEQEEEKDILNYIKDSKVIEDIIIKSICYDVNSNKIKIDQRDEKTIQKIKSIKEILK